MMAASMQKEETCRRKMQSSGQGENLGGRWNSPRKEPPIPGLPQGKAKDASPKPPGTQTRAEPPGRGGGGPLGFPQGEEGTSPEGWDPCAPGSAAGGHNAGAGGRRGQGPGSRPAGAGRVQDGSWPWRRGIPGEAPPGPAGSAAGSPAPATSGEEGTGRRPLSSSSARVGGETPFPKSSHAGPP